MGKFDVKYEYRLSNKYVSWQGNTSNLTLYDSETGKLGDNLDNTMAADALAPNVARSSTAMILTV